MSECDGELRDLTRRLVSIPSHEDETAAGDAVESWLRSETDATVERDPDGNVIARRNPDAPTSLALVGHHDVVPPADRQLEDEGYVIAEREGRLHGRGTADMKGALAACLLAFRDAAPPADREIAFASFVGEEDGGVGARAAIDRGFAPDFAVVAEGSTGYSAPPDRPAEVVTDVAVAHKGRRGSTLVAAGEAAHASETAAGENAVYRACDAVDVVRNLHAPETTVFGEHVAGSIAVTGIEGGTAMNVIPDRCTVTVDERTVPGERAPLERVETVEGIEWTVDGDLPPMACSHAGFADVVLEVARAAHRADAGVEDEHDFGAESSEETDFGATSTDEADIVLPEHVVKPHATDAGWLADAGTACVVCGPAEPGEAHTETESVSLDVLRRCRRIYRGIAEREIPDRE
ncbi:M20 family metallopeptidase [Halopenitus persicus]|uniref:M20 family metallopeptidase n=1 Tax=Halopenitus persicus TaxID=1048396 RepID=UPI000BBAEB15|nr:M20/M25/M40 family metallo-hydrolase [Halopenitus persicus]